MLSELNRLKLRQTVYNALIAFKQSRSPYNFLDSYIKELVSNTDNTDDINNINMVLTALKQNYDDNLVGYISNMSDEIMNNILNFFN